MPTIPATAQWKYSTTITKADPGPGFFRMNAANWTSATEMYISATDTTGTDYSPALDGVVHDSLFYVIAGSGTVATLQVAGVVSRQTDPWYIIPIKWLGGGAPKNGTPCSFNVIAKTRWSLQVPGDTAEWDITDAFYTEIWVGGEFVGAVIRAEVRKFGFNWTPVPIFSNRSPSVVYSGEVVLPEGTTVVGGSNMVHGANRLRIVLKSIGSGYINVEIASRKTTGLAAETLPLQVLPQEA